MVKPTFLCSKINEKLGQVDVLVNSVGIWYLTLMTILREDKWDQMVDVNCKVCIG